MAQNADALTAVFQAAATALQDYITQRLTAQDVKIADQDMKISSLQADAQRVNDARIQKDKKLNDAVDGLQGQINQLDGVLNSLSNDFAQTLTDVTTLEAKVTVLDARIGRRASKSELSAVAASIDGLGPNHAGAPDQTNELSRGLRGVQEQVSKLRDAALFQDASSDLALSDVPAPDMMELSDEATGGDQDPSPIGSGGAPIIGMPTASHAKPGKNPISNIVSTASKQGSRTPIIEVAVRPVEPATVKSITKARAAKGTLGRPQPIAGFLTPSRIRRSLAPGSEATVMSEVSKKPARRSNVTSLRQAREALALADGFVDMTRGVSSSITDSDDEFLQEDLTEDDAAEEDLECEVADNDLDDQVAVGGEASENITEEEPLDQQVFSDTGPVKRLDRDLYRNQWHADGQPCLLDDYVRQQRALVNVDDDRPHTRVKAPVNYKQPPPPKLRATQASRSKRPAEADEATLAREAEGARTGSKKMRETAETLLRSFQTPSRQSKPGSSTQ